MKFESIHSEKFGKFSSVQLDTEMKHIVGGWFYTEVAGPGGNVDRYETLTGNGWDGAHDTTVNSVDHYV